MADRDRNKTLGSGLDEVGFQPLGRRVSIKSEPTPGKELRLSHPTPAGVDYDRQTGRIVVEFTNGAAFSFPARSLKGLEYASESEISEVALLGETGLHWERLNVDHEISTLISWTFGTPSFMASVP